MYPLNNICAKQHGKNAAGTGMHALGWHAAIETRRYIVCRGRTASLGVYRVFDVRVTSGTAVTGCTGPQQAAGLT